MKFLWTTLHVKNIDESLTFYSEILGLKEMRRLEYPTGKVIIFLGEGDTQIELIYSQDEAVNMGESISIGFEVESIQDIIRTLQDKNIPIHSGPFSPTPHISFLYVLDPNGLKVQFAQRS